MSAQYIVAHLGVRNSMFPSSKCVCDFHIACHLLSSVLGGGGGGGAMNSPSHILNMGVSYSQCYADGTKHFTQSIIVCSHVKSKQQLLPRLHRLIHQRIMASWSSHFELITRYSTVEIADVVISFACWAK